VWKEKFSETWFVTVIASRIPSGDVDISSAGAVGDKCQHQ